MAPIDNIRTQLAGSFFRSNPNPAVNGVAIVTPMLNNAPQEIPTFGPESIFVFVDPSAAPCEVNAINQVVQEQNKPGVPYTILRAPLFVGLQAKTGTSVAPSTPFQYNVPPICAGTFGAQVNAGGKSYALTSNHVAAQNGRAPARALVFTPGAIDDPAGGQTLGFLSYFVELNPSKRDSLGTPIPGPNQVDCALAEVDPKVVPPGAINQSVTVVPLPVSLKTKVKKTGRTTGETHSFISIRDWEGPIAFSFGTYFFQDLIGAYDAVSSMGHNPFAAPGDSGSLVVDEGNKQGFGLVTARGLIYDATNNFTAYAILFCSLDLVAQKLAGMMNLQKNQLSFLF